MEEMYYMINIKIWLQGEITIENTGWGSDRLLNLCKRNDISIRNLKTIEDGYIFFLMIGSLPIIFESNSLITTVSVDFF